MRGKDTGGSALPRQLVTTRGLRSLAVRCRHSRCATPTVRRGLFALSADRARIGYVLRIADRAKRPVAPDGLPMDLIRARQMIHFDLHSPHLAATLNSFWDSPVRKTDSPPVITAPVAFAPLIPVALYTFLVLTRPLVWQCGQMRCGLAPMSTAPSTRSMRGLDPRLGRLVALGPCHAQKSDDVSRYSLQIDKAHLFGASVGSFTGGACPATASPAGPSAVPQEPQNRAVADDFAPQTSQNNFPPDRA